MIIKSKYFILAPSGIGKTTATAKYPNIIADLDWVNLRNYEEKNTDGKVITRKRNPDFLIDFARGIAHAFKTHPVVVTPTHSIPAEFVRIIKNSENESLNANDIRELAKQTLKNYSSLHKETLTEQEFSSEIERLTTELTQVLQQLKEISFEPVVTVPDSDCVDQLVENRMKRDEHKPAHARETPDSCRIRNIKTIKGSEELYETGLYSKLPMRKGQYFLDIFENNAIIPPSIAEKTLGEQLNLLQKSKDEELTKL